MAAVLADLSDAQIDHHWNVRGELVVINEDEAVVDEICGEVEKMYGPE